MCGIAGIILKAHATLPDLGERLGAMARAMVHRGPDNEGIYVSAGGRVGLANRRLAIRDLSPNGQMPMGNAQGNVWITYNGEIYNAAGLRTELESLGYRFHSKSDTEVLLHGYEAWGEAVVERLRGMFAFAILDERIPNQPTLFVARDHMGIKPLYYAETADALLLASETKALLASGLVSREISPAGLVGYLAMGSVTVPHTIYRGITALEPASTFTIQPGQRGALSPMCYWRLPVDTIEPSDAGEVVEEVRGLLADAVRIRLVSDVPLGAFLSGGLDSSTVVALMRQATEGPIRTCSMVFEEAAYSEAPYARAVACATGAEHYERVITAREVAHEMERILWAMDQPSIDGVNSYFVSRTAREAGLTVALSGVGGDELFGGYPNTFRQVPKVYLGLQVARTIPGSVTLGRGLARALANRQGLARFGDALARPASLASAYLTRRGLFAPSEIRNLVSGEIWEEAQRAFDPVRHVAARADIPAASQSPASAFNWVSRAELRTYTHHQLLRDTDVMSMAHSLEVRVPLLDRRLVEMVLRLPAAAKVNGVGPKALLLRAMRDQLPSLIAERRDKQGFVFPFDRWLRGPLHPYLREISSLEGMLDHAAVRAIYARFEQGSTHWSRAWALAALAGWAHSRQRVRG